MILKAEGMQMRRSMGGVAQKVSEVAHRANHRMWSDFSIRHILSCEGRRILLVPTW